MTPYLSWHPPPPPIHCELVSGPPLPHNLKSNSPNANGPLSAAFVPKIEMAVFLEEYILFFSSCGHVFIHKADFSCKSGVSGSETSEMLSDLLCMGSYPSFVAH